MWPQLQVQYIPGKKTQGLVAAKDLPANTRIIYRGILMTEDEAAQQGDDTYHCWTGIEGNSDILDGSPSIDPNPDGIGGLGWFIGAKINEPSASQTANLTWLQGKYRGKNRMMMVSVRPINMGEELLIHYGSEYHQRAYRPGLTAPIPPWLEQTSVFE